MTPSTKPTQQDLDRQTTDFGKIVQDNLRLVQAEIEKSGRTSALVSELHYWTDKAADMERYKLGHREGETILDYRELVAEIFRQDPKQTLYEDQLKIDEERKRK